MIDSLDTNLLASSKKPVAPVTLPSPANEKRKKTLKVFAYIAIFLFFLIFFFVLKIPNSLVQNLALSALNQDPSLQWQADRIQTRALLLPHLYAENLSLQAASGSSIHFKTMRIFPSLFSLIPWTGSFQPKISFDGESYQAKFTGSIRPKTMDVELSVANADFSKLTPLLEAGIDIKGILSSLKSELSLSNNRLSQASGTIEAQGKNLVIDPAAFGVPMALPILDIGILDIQAKAERGKVLLEKMQLGSPGKDLEVRASGDMQLMDNMDFSRLNLKLRVKPSEKILQAMPALRSMLGSMGALQSDGFYAMKISGTLNQMGLPQPDP